ncbi:methyl-accepting chemotaxis protein [Amphritea sp. 1_MG-2023]|uniref:methyl-accepting chemotaxis protein n=1 Tax=Amphritea sp. 1_MG-2023 TaxID=3062670 RepID=UPI0026E2E696|nr:methyl-accepting chemotaxis protein [Amphritea sp. 1_MG-2023]MDO6563942.1 methyl-accepting chemotaxis protein [Amphritea sp. 1_MG-2023]
MKISQINLMAAAILLLVVSVMACLMFWSLERLNNSFDQTRSYQQLKLEIDTKVTRPILIYLSSGEASLLSEIDNALIQLIRQDVRVKALTDNGIPAVENTLTELQSVALLQLRAAGKLRQPQELLINNEREILSNISLLNDYANKGAQQQPQLQQRYIAILNKISPLIPELAHSRQHFFTAAHPNRSDVERRLHSLASIANKLSELPRFNIYEATEADDSLAALLGNNSVDTDRPRSELGELYTQELSNLIRRYPKELTNIEKIYARKATTIANTTALIDQLNNHLQENQNRLQTHYDATDQLVNILLIVSLSLIIFIGLIMSLLNTKLSRIISGTCQQLDALANGRLTQEDRKTSRIIEIEILESSIASLRDYFTALIDKINTESTTLDQLGKNLNNSSDTLTRIVSKQQLSTEQASVQIQQLSCSYQEVAKNAVKTSEATRKATETAVHGVTEMQNTRESIRQLETEAEATNLTLQQLKDDGKEIGSALNVIQNFAAQTNLLALNAAIEAARAGNSGRGFAVVADEVRSLALNTATAADNIGVIINKLNGAIDQMANKVELQAECVHNTVTLAENARQSVEQIRISINEIDSMSSMIASATEEQSTVTNQISDVINMTLEHSQESALEAENNKQHARQVDHTSNSLMQLLQQFKQRQ